MMERAVDLPALWVSQWTSKYKESNLAYPFDPNRTNIPVFGMSRLRSPTAVTVFFELNRDILKVLFKFLTEIARLSSNGSDVTF